MKCRESETRAVQHRTCDEAGHRTGGDEQPVVFGVYSGLTRNEEVLPGVVRGDYIDI